MTLDQIYKRLDLFHEYLKYRIDAKFTQIGFTYTPEYIIDTFKKHGFLINVNEVGVSLLSYDQWLMLHGYKDLVIEDEVTTIGIKTF